MHKFVSEYLTRSISEDNPFVAEYSLTVIEENDEGQQYKVINLLVVGPNARTPAVYTTVEVGPAIRRLSRFSEYKWVRRNPDTPHQHLYESLSLDGDWYTLHVENEPPVEFTAALELRLNATLSLTQSHVISAIVAPRLQKSSTLIYTRLLSLSSYLTENNIAYPYTTRWDEGTSFGWVVDGAPPVQRDTPADAGVWTSITASSGFLRRNDFAITAESYAEDMPSLVAAQIRGATRNVASRRNAPTSGIINDADNPEIDD